MKAMTIHWNPPEVRAAGYSARCGRSLFAVQWRDDLKDVTCDSCLYYAYVDEMKAQDAARSARKSI